jgi:phospholipid transport system substrate-binding protein
MIRGFSIKSPRPALAALLLLAVPLVAPRPAAADDPGGFIQNLGTQAIQVLGPAVPPGVRNAKFRQLLENDFDLQGIARFALGGHVRQMTPEQQQEFLALYRDNLVQAYSRKLAQYAGEPFHVTGSRQVGDETIVTSEVERAGGAPVEIDWHVVDRDGHPLVNDVAIDGVSQKVTQRNQFGAIIQRNGGRPEAVIAALRQELAGDAEPRSGSSVPPPGYGR